MTLTGHPLERAILETDARLSSDAYGSGDRSRFHWCAKDERGEATAFFIACAGRFRSDLGIKAEP
jgi:hypothetical protein